MDPRSSSTAPDSDEPSAYLKRHGGLARQHGYWLGDAPPGYNITAVHLSSWENVTSSSDDRDILSPQGEGMSPAEADEALRAEGALSAARPEGDVSPGFRPTVRPLRSAQLMSSWDRAAQNAYFATSAHGPTWGDQAWHRTQRPAAPKAPRRECRQCGERFQPQRSTARYCSDGCRLKAFRGKRRAVQR
jgi:hypothetical protein